GGSSASRAWFSRRPPAAQPRQSGRARALTIWSTRGGSCGISPGEILFLHQPYAAAALWRKRRAEHPRGVDDPGAVAGKRSDAGHPAAAILQFWPGGPAHHADDNDAPVLVAKYRRAGIAAAGAEPGAVALGLRIEQPDLQAAGYSRSDKCRCSNYAAGAAVAAHGDAVAGDHKGVADSDRLFFGAERHRQDFGRQWRRELDQRHGGGGEMAEQPLEIELRIALDARDVFQYRPLARRTGDELVFGARLHAMGGGEQEVARDRGGGADGAALAQNHHHRSPGAVGRRRRAADHGASGCDREQGDQAKGESANECHRHFHLMP